MQQQVIWGESEAESGVHPCATPAGGHVGRRRRRARRIQARRQLSLLRRLAEGRPLALASDWCASCGRVRAISLAWRCGACASRMPQVAADDRLRGRVALAVATDALGGVGSLAELAADAGITVRTARRTVREIRQGGLGGQKRAAGRVAPPSPAWRRVPEDERPTALWFLAQRRLLLPYLSVVRSWADLASWADSLCLVRHELQQLIAWCEEKGDIVWKDGWVVSEEEEVCE